mgnify:CR=1 FL=1
MELVDPGDRDDRGLAGVQRARGSRTAPLATSAAIWASSKPSSCSTAVLCSPSRASILTGLYTHKHGVIDNNRAIPPGTQFFPEYLQRAGYQTALSGKMHFVGPDQLHGFEDRLTTDIYPADFGWTPDWSKPHDRIDWWYHNMTSVKQAGIAEKTLVLFFSDNGPFLSYGNHAGSAAPLREGKLTSYEGGVRVPFIAHWPNKVPAGKISDEPLTEMDILPTIQTWLGAKGPTFKIDGKDVSDLWLGKETAKSPHEALVFYGGSELQAIRRGNWKLHFPHPYITPHAEPGRDGKPSNWENMKPAAITQSGIQGIATRHGYRVAEQSLALYNLREDSGETKDVSAAHPEIVERLTKLAQPLRLELGDSLTKTAAQAARPLGRDDSSN